MGDDFRSKLAQAELDLADAEDQLIDATSARKEAAENVKAKQKALRRLLRDDLHPEDRPLLAAAEAKAAPPADDWRAIPLSRLTRDRKLGQFLATQYELHTVGDVYNMERDGDSLFDLGMGELDRQKLRASLLDLREERGWGPDEGYPAAWLEPPKADDQVDAASPEALGVPTVEETPAGEPVKFTFQVLSKDSQRPSYSVLAPTLQEAVRLNAERHPGDADNEIRALRKGEKPAGPTFDLTKPAYSDAALVRPEKPAKKAKKASKPRPAPEPGAAMKLLEPDDRAAQAVLEAARLEGESAVEHFDRMNAEIKARQPRRKHAARA